MATLHRNYRLAYGLVLVGFLLPLPQAAQEVARSAPQFPADWYVYPSRKLENLDQQTSLCFNYSQNEWKVTTAADGIQVSRLVGSLDSTTPLPFHLKHEKEMIGRASSIHFNGAWLVGFEAGEFGGGLWLTNEDGSKAKHILRENVQAIVPLRDVVLVLSGLAHMGFDYGNAYFFSPPAGMTLPLEHEVRLPGEPRAYVKETDTSVLVVTTRTLSRISDSGEQAALRWFPPWVAQQYANSIVVDADGSIVIGMRMFVLRLTEHSGSYEEEWMLPKECRNFTVQKFDCKCRP